MLLQAPVLNFCANNYLGLSNHPEVVEAGVQVGHWKKEEQEKGGRSRRRRMTRRSSRSRRRRRNSRRRHY